MGGIGKAIGGAVGSIGNLATGGLFGQGGAMGPVNMPGPAPENVSGNTNALIQAQKAKAGQTQGDIQSEYSRGIDQSGVLPQNQAQVERQAAALGGPQAYSQAIQNRAAKSYGLDLNRINQQISAESPLIQNQQMDTAAMAANKNYAAQLGAVTQARQERAQAIGARNSMIGSILGLGGTVAGTVGGTSMKAPPDTSNDTPEEYGGQEANPWGYH